MAAEGAADLLSIDASSVSVAVADATVAAEKAYIDSLPDDKLFDTISEVQEQLAKAMAALEKKGGAQPAASTSGPCAFFEGVPIDCGAVAAVAIQAYFDQLSTAEMQAMVSTTEAELAKATAALAKKKSAPAPAAPAAPSTPAALTTPPRSTPPRSTPPLSAPRQTTPPPPRSTTPRCSTTAPNTRS